MGTVQIIVTLVIFLLLVMPAGRYVYQVIDNQKSKVDVVFDPIDRLIYKLCGIKMEGMSWRKYAASILLFNGAAAVFVFAAFKLQHVLGLNPNNTGGMESTLTFHTVISFITNTNLQDYAGESALSYLSQMIGITFLMFAAAATGLAVATAFIRGIVGRQNFGNFFVDLVRITTRILLPMSVILTVFLIWQGVPQTLSANRTVTTLEGRMQDIALGPVASLEAIKQLGTNGGGFFGANSAHPFENPTPLTNLIEILSMMLLPGGLVVAYGHMVKNKRQAYAVFAAMFLLLLVSLGVVYGAERAGNPRIEAMGIHQTLGNMEGKELRFGVSGSSMFTTITTAFTTGSVNNMHDSLMPMSILAALWQMMTNVVFGGKGAGFMNMIMFAMLTVFLAGLMVGRTPEFLGKKIEPKEIKLIAVAILIHPIIILLPTAFTLVSGIGAKAITNPGFHGLSQILYQYTTAAANNGSNLAGTLAATPFWNIATGLVMIIGRYASMIILLAVAGSLASKQSVAEGPGTFRTDNYMFVGLLIIIVVIIGALTFFPALALGPIAEHLAL